MRIFAYLRVSPLEANLSKRKQKILDDIEGLQVQRIFSDSVKISVPALDRPEFTMLINNRMEPGDKLIVDKLDGLGASTTNILHTINYLNKNNIIVQSLDIPYDDINGNSMNYILPVFNAIFEFDKEKIIEEHLLLTNNTVNKDCLQPLSLENKELGHSFGNTLAKPVDQDNKQQLSEKTAYNPVNLAVNPFKNNEFKAGEFELSNNTDSSNDKQDETQDNSLNSITDNREQGTSSYNQFETSPVLESSHDQATEENVDNKVDSDKAKENVNMLSLSENSSIANQKSDSKLVDDFPDYSIMIDEEQKNGNRESSDYTPVAQGDKSQNRADRNDVENKVNSKADEIKPISPQHPVVEQDLAELSSINKTMNNANHEDKNDVSELSNSVANTKASKGHYHDLDSIVTQSTAKTSSLSDEMIDAEASRDETIMDQADSTKAKNVFENTESFKLELEELPETNDNAGGFIQSSQGFLDDELSQFKTSQSEFGYTSGTTPTTEKINLDKELEEASNSNSNRTIPKEKSILSPLYGSFYFIQDGQGNQSLSVGSKINVGQKIGHIDVKGLHNTILADKSGTIAELTIAHGEEVNIDQILLILE